MPDRHGPYRHSRFILEIDSLAIASFSECSLPENTTDVVEYREGNDPPTTRKLWSLNEYGPLILQKGVTTDSIALFEWRQQVEEGAVDNARRPIAIILLDEEGEPGPRWEFQDAWPTTYDAPDLDATGTDVAIERLEITHEGMQRVE